MTDTSSKRRYPRLGTQRMVILKEVDGEPRKDTLRTRSMSPGGLSLTSAEGLPEGSRLGFHLALGDEVVKLEGRVAYCRPLPEEEFEIGVVYTGLEPETRRMLILLLESQASLEASLFATSLSVEITRYLEGRRSEEPKITHADCLAALELVRLRLEKGAAEEQDEEPEL